jgi:hypothetical protein
MRKAAVVIGHDFRSASLISPSAAWIKAIEPGRRLDQLQIGCLDQALGLLLSSTMWLTICMRAASPFALPADTTERSSTSRDMGRS